MRDGVSLCTSAAAPTSALSRAPVHWSRAARRAGGEARARLVVLADEVLAGLDVDGARLVLYQPVAAYGERLLGAGLLLGLGLGLGLEP